MSDPLTSPAPFPTYQPATKLKHSPLGIVSFALSLLSGLGMLAVMVIAGVMEATTPGGISEEETAAAIVGLAMFAFVGASLLALGLGIGALFAKNRNRLFAILGAAFAALTIAGTVFVLVLGLSMQ